MKQKFFLGIDVTPRKEYRFRIQALELLYKQKCEDYDLKCKECEFEQKERELLAEERNQWKQKYHDLLEDTPARGKGGKFVKRNKSHKDRPLDMEKKA